jgi:ribosomal protein S18 acetylase RimI-like enzyme
MAVALRPTPFEIVDLRIVNARSLAELFGEEERQWQRELQWDYRPSVDMIRRHVDAHSLPGYVALRQGHVAGYCFFLYEEDKGLLGDLYVVEKHRHERPYDTRAGIATLLLEHSLETLENSPPVRRIEAQLLPFGTEPLEPVFQAHHFDRFPRLFMFKKLTPAGPPRRGRHIEAAREEQQTHAGTGAELRLWEDQHFEAMAELIVDAYTGHVDSRINDHYQDSSGALRFLKNIVLFPGCGVFRREASLVAVRPGDHDRLLGAALSSQVARGVAHITQVCVRRPLQGSGLGRALVEGVLERLAAQGYHGVSLTVTASNQGAVQLYQRLGFEVTKQFSAFARNLG